MDKAVIKTGMAIAFCMALSACTNMPGIYKTDIMQGNKIDEKRLARILPGMAQDEVQLILGTPLVIDPYNTNVWYYTYIHHKSNGTKIEQMNAKIIFDQQQHVVRVDNQL